jgi:hypothetical protein
VSTFLEHVLLIVQLCVNSIDPSWGETVLLDSVVQRSWSLVVFESDNVLDWLKSDGRLDRQSARFHWCLSECDCWVSEHIVYIP